MLLEGIANLVKINNLWVNFSQDYSDISSVNIKMIRKI